MDAYAGWRVHDDADSELRLDGGVEDSLLLLQVEHQAQLRQRQAGRPGEAEQRVVEVDGIAAQPPVMSRTWDTEEQYFNFLCSLSAVAGHYLYEPKMKLIKLCIKESCKCNTNI